MCVCVHVQYTLLCAGIYTCVCMHCGVHMYVHTYVNAHNYIIYWYLYVYTMVYNVYSLQYLRQLDKPGHYMMYNYGEIHPTTSADNYSITMRFRHTDFQNSMVTFHIDASDVTYVYSV